MTDQLSIYNGALLLTGSRRLVSLSEAQESRRILDEVWNSGGGVKHCLEMGFWKHAMRKQTLSYNTGVTPTDGYRYEFDKPVDLVNIYALCEDEFFNWPVYQIEDQGDTWRCDLQTIYVRYVSNGASYGLDYTLWPESFTRFVEAYFASRIIKRLTDARTDAQDVMEEYKRLKLEAKSKDAMKEPTKGTTPTGWQMARNRDGWGRRRQHPYR